MRKSSIRIPDRHNLIPVHAYADEAEPGSTTVGREGLEDLLYLARQKPRAVEDIIFWSLSRLARNKDDSLFIRADLRRRGYVLHSMTDDVLYGEFSYVAEASIGWKNERYLKDLSQDVKRGPHDLARKGYAPGGFPPRGYLADKVQFGVKRTGEPHVVSTWVHGPELAPCVMRTYVQYPREKSLPRSASLPALVAHQTLVRGPNGTEATTVRTAA